MRNIADELGNVEPVPRTNVSAILHEFARRLPRRGIVISCSDLFDDIEEF